MRRIKKAAKAGFTLVELMIVVAIIGVLAALAIYGVGKYLASAKTSEAKNTVGAIARAAVAAYERESMNNAILADGAVGAAATRALCTSAAFVPVNIPVNQKYQPSTVAGADYDTGSSVAGWKCLGFAMTQPTYYSYGYVTGVGSALSGADATGFEAAAYGDLNGNAGGAAAGGVPAATVGFFARGAVVRNNQLVLSTTLFVQNEAE